MALVLILLKAAAIFLMTAAGFRLARTTPTGEDDEALDDLSYSGYPWWGHWNFRCDGIGCLMLGGMLPGWPGVNLFAVAALVLAFFGWREQIFDELSYSFLAYSILMFKPFWILSGAALAGYSAGRVTGRQSAGHPD